MKVAEIAVTPVLAKSDTLGRDCQTEGNDFWRSGGKPQVNLAPTRTTLQTLGIQPTDPSD
jgi:hypothetical protein